MKKCIYNAARWPIDMLLCAIVVVLISASPCALAQSLPLMKRVVEGDKQWTRSIESRVSERQRITPGLKIIAVAVNPNQLTRENVSLELPEGPAIIIPKGEYRLLATHSSWSGVVKKDQTFVSLVLTRGRVSGIIQRGDINYKVEPTDTPYISTISEAQANSKPDHDSTTAPIPPPVLHQFELEYQQKKNESTGSATQFVAPANLQIASAAPTRTVIDALIFTSPAARAFMGTDAALNEMININVAGANTAFLETNIQLNVVDISPLLSFPENPAEKLEDVLERFASIPLVAQKRNQVGADIVLLISGPYNKECGIAYYGPSPTAAYGIITTDVLCPPTNYHMAHEVGHILGGDHNVTNAWVKPGKAHGWPDATDLQRFDIGPKIVTNCVYTVMAYPTFVTQFCDSGKPRHRVPLFSSNTIITNVGGEGANYPLGDLTVANNYSVIVSNRSVVAGFRGSKSSGNQTPGFKAKAANTVLDLLLKDGP